MSSIPVILLISDAAKFTHFKFSSLCSSRRNRLLDAAYLSLRTRRNLFDIVRSHQIVNERAQSKQVVRSERGSNSRSLCEQIRFRHVCPRRQNRAQAPVRVEIHHPIIAPVQMPTDQHEAISAKRVEWMDDLEERAFDYALFLMTDSC
jgi:hypothetical protein